MEIFKNIIPDIITKVWLTGVGASLQKFTLANQTSPMARFL